MSTDFQPRSNDWNPAPAFAPEGNEIVLTDAERAIVDEHYSIVPEEAWSIVSPVTRKFIYETYKVRGLFVHTILTTALRDPRKNVPLASKVPPELAVEYERAHFSKGIRYLVTDREEWWPYPHFIPVVDDATVFLYALYIVVKNTHALHLLEHKPLHKRGPGRPRDPLVQERREEEREQKQAHAQWLQACQERKARIAAAHKAYKDALEELEPLRRAWKEAEEEPVPVKGI